MAHFGEILMLLNRFFLGLGSARKALHGLSLCWRFIVMYVGFISGYYLALKKIRVQVMQVKIFFAG